MSKTPMIDRLLHHAWRIERANLVLEQAVGDGTATVEIMPLRHFAAELRALRARVPQPTRKLREVKGVTYRDGFWWKDGVKHRYAHEVLHNWCSTIFDADHAAIYALKDLPYEPVERVEDVMSAYFGGLLTPNQREQFTARLRAAVLAEQGEP